ncbi:bifunctional 6-phosphofructo-2-kinase/fructose-2,6-bisphosphate 2-phosphatase [Nadsonia fulvescens var. elongata DSM 6958]|uniref:Bifunctional 6-phosphofructo-2-kinase/fructose-2,6-bisphosphate 2-phosphatase n=1 Tax=Nadsonia fulvescens var. elongata DSM 6958 TaxID=857566 RepID=A0A1E3PHS1_9ASCO|nr:bifunctional 6-phosphofructo-2-kinase/fructose-2,6-bisphosphate 2-phosphatase [Nadsonia fulvescens var. elongata DSM 6958]
MPVSIPLPPSDSAVEVPLEEAALASHGAYLTEKSHDSGSLSSSSSTSSFVPLVSNNNNIRPVLVNAISNWNCQPALIATSAVSTPINGGTATAAALGDGIHQTPGANEISPAQLYATESGSLFHAGKICIVLVGLPARGKTHIAVSLTRYLRWLGVKAHAFHLGDYRRKYTGEHGFKSVPDDYFKYDDLGNDGERVRQNVIEQCLSDITKFLFSDQGQIAIYDAVNPTPHMRKSLKESLSKEGIQALFIESICTDEKIVARNIKDVKITSPDYQGWDSEVAVAHYLKRITLGIPNYQSLSVENESDLSWIKIINISEKFITNKLNQVGYLANRVLFFLMNTHQKQGCVYFANCGSSALPTSGSQDRMVISYKQDPVLSIEGQAYAEKLAKTILNRIQERNQSALHSHKKADTTAAQFHLAGNVNEPDSSSYSGVNTPSNEADITVWTSTRRRTIETAKPFQDRGIHTRQRPQLSQLNPGDIDGLTREEVRIKYPDEYEASLKDPYHVRFPRSESYHDLAVRLESLIMELERLSGDVLIIAHHTVIQVLYGYLMASKVDDIPKISFARNQVLEIVSNAYMNKCNVIDL